MALRTRTLLNTGFSRGRALAFPFAFAFALVSCGGGDSTSPETPVLVNRTPILFTSGKDGNIDIYMMEADGSDVRRLTTDARIDQHADWSPDGFHFAFMSNRDGDYEVYVMLITERGLLQLTHNTSISDGFPRWSPDGSRLLFTSNRDGPFNLYVMDADGSNVRRVTQGIGDHSGGAWSPDGSRIAFLSTRDGSEEIYLIGADGTNPVRLTTNTDIEGSRIVWSPVTNRIAFHAYHPDGTADIYAIDPDGGNLSRLTNASGVNRYPAWTPDGNRIAFTSNRDGSDEVHIMNADGSGVTRLTKSAAPAALDSWRR